jgi:hypothetical protein
LCRPGISNSIKRVVHTPLKVSQVLLSLAASLSLLCVVVDNLRLLFGCLSGQEFRLLRCWDIALNRLEDRMVIESYKLLTQDLVLLHVLLCSDDLGQLSVKIATVASEPAFSHSRSSQLYRRFLFPVCLNSNLRHFTNLKACLRTLAPFVHFLGVSVAIVSVLCNITALSSIQLAVGGRLVALVELSFHRCEVGRRRLLYPCKGDLALCTLEVLPELVPEDLLLVHDRFYRGLRPVVP